MKKYLFLSFLISLKTIAQSVEIKPGSNGFVMIPNVSILGTCTLQDKGKIVYLGTDNTLRMCNGSSWVDISTTGNIVLPFSQSTSNNSNNGIFKIENTASTSISNGIQGIINSKEGAALLGISNQTTPTYFTYGVSGINNSTNGYGTGVYGESNFGSGVNGSTQSGTAVYGTSSSGNSIRGLSNTGTGVTGIATSAAGIGGVFSNSIGIALQSSGKLRIGGVGVGTVEAGRFLKSTNSNGDAEWGELLPYSFLKNVAQNILDITNTNTGGFSTIVGRTSSTGSGSGIEGIATHTGSNSNTRGVTGINNSATSNGAGVYGFHAGTGNGVWGYSNVGTGVYGSTNSGNGILGESLSNSTGVYGKSGSGIGIRGLATNNGTGVDGLSENGGVGVSGTSESGIGIFGNSNYIAGYFTSPLGYALVTYTGNVGIGTTTPAAKMDIQGSLYLSHFYYGASEDTYIRGGKAGSKVIINDIGSGSVGIGVISPNQYLDVNGRMRLYHTGPATGPNALTSGLWTSNSVNSFNSNDGAFYGMKTDTEAGIFIGGSWKFWVNSAGDGTFTGKVTASNFPTPSDRRYKRNIKPLVKTLSKIECIDGVSYDFRKDEFPEKNFSDKPQIGFIAQDLEKIFPEMVFTDEKGFKSVDYAKMTPILVEAVKELKQENEALRKNNNNLESRLNRIEKMLNSLDT